MVTLAAFSGKLGRHTPKEISIRSQSESSHANVKMALLDKVKRPSKVIFLNRSEYISLTMYGICFNRRRNVSHP